MKKNKMKKKLLINLLGISGSMVILTTNIAKPDPNHNIINVQTKVFSNEKQIMKYYSNQSISSAKKYQTNIPMGKIRLNAMNFIFESLNKKGIKLTKEQKKMIELVFESGVTKYNRIKKDIKPKKIKTSISKKVNQIFMSPSGYGGFNDGYSGSVTINQPTEKKVALKKNPDEIFIIKDSGYSGGFQITKRKVTRTKLIQKTEDLLHNLHIAHAVFATLAATAGLISAGATLTTILTMGASVEITGPIALWAGAAAIIAGIIISALNVFIDKENKIDKWLKAGHALLLVMQAGIAPARLTLGIFTSEIKKLKILAVFPPVQIALSLWDIYSIKKDLDYLAT